MAYQINGTNIPSSIYNAGTYTPPAYQPLRRNGQGATIRSRYQLATWAWPIMSKSDYEWWTQTILSGELSLRCAARLPNETWTETAYATIIVQNVTSEGLLAGHYKNVKLEIEILP